MAGGLGPKKVDVSWATEESGLLLAISVKSINFRDRRSGNFQKNLVNRRGDMLFESVTLHRRFPFSVLAGCLILDHQAANDTTGRRRSTFVNAHSRLRLFTGRDDPAGRDEQYEKLYVVLLDANPFKPDVMTYAVGDWATPVALAAVFDELIELVATRNPRLLLGRSGRHEEGALRGLSRPRTPGVRLIRGATRHGRARARGPAGRRPSWSSIGPSSFVAGIDSGERPRRGRLRRIR
jgi:hypothetical protein